MRTVLVIGASGFVGRQLTRALLAQGIAVRCLARDPARVQDLATAGCEVARGDVADLELVQRAMESVDAVFISIHTLSPQRGSGALARFMDIEKQGLQNVVAACRSQGVGRVIYVTSLGISRDAPSEWLRERWHAERSLLNSGLAATVVRPGMIVGVGGRGFDAVVSNARRRTAILMGADRPKTRAIALDDLVYYLAGVLDDPRASGQCYEVGHDDALSTHEMIDIAADILGRRPPTKIPIPLTLLGAAAPALERLGKLPRGAVRGLVDALKIEAIGDPMPIRAILPRPLLSFRQATARALAR